MEIIKLLIDGVEAIVRETLLEAHAAASKIRRADTEEEKMKIVETAARLEDEAIAYRKLVRCLKKTNGILDKLTMD